jgi:hypothetical protein
MTQHDQWIAQGHPHLNMMTPTKKDSNLVICHHKVTSATHHGKKIGIFFQQ